MKPNHKQTQMNANKKKSKKKLTVRQVLALVRRQPETVSQALQAYEAGQMKNAPNGIEQRRVAEDFPKRIC